jgi:hypothetical protein
MPRDIDKLRAILLVVRPLQFDEIPRIDLLDRLALLTVVAGLREVAAFGFAQSRNEDAMRELKDVLSNYGLPTQLTFQIPPAPYRSLDIPPELSDIFDRYDSKPVADSRLLWVCSSPKTREQIKQVTKREISTGTLLGYPRCFLLYAGDFIIQCTHDIVTAAHGDAAARLDEDIFFGNVRSLEAAEVIVWITRDRPESCFGQVKLEHYVQISNPLEPDIAAAFAGSALMLLSQFGFDDISVVVLAEKTSRGFKFFHGEGGPGKNISCFQVDRLLTDKVQ